MSDLSRVLATLSEFGDTFDKANDRPPTQPILKTAAATVDDANGSMPSLRHALSMSDRILMQKELQKLDTNELVFLFGEQLKKADRGVPVGHDPYLATALGSDPVISKVLDTTGGAALQRQDLEPILWSIF